MFGTFTNNMRWFYILVFFFKFLVIQTEVKFRISRSTTCLPQGLLLQRLTQVSVEKCMVKCLAMSECLALTYNRRFKLCELYSDKGESDVTSSNDKESCFVIEKQSICIEKNQTVCGNGTREADDSQEKFCPVFTLVNGIVFGNMNSVGARVEYSCNKHFKEESAGRTFSICQENGTWTYLPQCIRYFEYIGCFIDRRSRMLNEARTSGPEMDTEYCVNYCFGQGFIYASTQSSYQCFCGNVTQFNDPAPEHECNRQCRGDPDEMCGGTWRGSLFRRI